MHKWIPDSSRECSDEDLGPSLEDINIENTNYGDSTYALPQVLGNSTKADGSVGTNTRLFVIRSTRQELEKFSVNGSITELIDNRQDGLDGLFSDDRSDIGKTRGLCIC